MTKRLLLSALLALPSCQDASPAVATAAREATAAAGVPARERLDRDRIYYDLTRFDWYARGEPLVSDGHGYQPAGMPVAAPLSELERAGEYQGVEYYRRTGDAERIYVPVFDGYWLPFQAAAVADPSD